VRDTLLSDRRDDEERDLISGREARDEVAVDHAVGLGGVDDEAEGKLRRGREGRDREGEGECRDEGRDLLAEATHVSTS
jgi:hypothetical protein